MGTSPRIPHVPYSWPFTAATSGGTGVFSVHPTTPSFGLGNSYGLALGDIDGDDDLDAIIANFGGEAETAWVNDGTGSFSAHPATPAFGGGDSAGVVLGDIDGDGDLDALVANANFQAETVWLNRNSANLSISKSVSPSEAAPGQTITYTLTYTNSGPRSASGMEITDTVPVSLTNVSYTSSGATITPTGSISYTWAVADLAVGGGASDVRQGAMGLTTGSWWRVGVVE